MIRPAFAIPMQKLYLGAISKFTQRRWLHSTVTGVKAYSQQLDWNTTRVSDRHGFYQQF